MALWHLGCGPLKVLKRKETSRGVSFGLWLFDVMLQGFMALGLQGCKVYI